MVVENTRRSSLLKRTYCSRASRKQKSRICRSVERRVRRHVRVYYSATRNWGKSARMCCRREKEPVANANQTTGQMVQLGRVDERKQRGRGSKTRLGEGVSFAWQLWRWSGWFRWWRDHWITRTTSFEILTVNIVVSKLFIYFCMMKLL